MEMSIRDAEGRFAEAAAAAAGRERVIVTRHGVPFVELVPARKTCGMDFGKAEEVRRALGLDGLDGLTLNASAEFNDPASSRQVLGLDD